MFDEFIDRKKTQSLKFDSHKKRNIPEDAFPLWVADMDFKTPAAVQAALKKHSDHGIFGYSEPAQSYYDALSSWFETHHDFSIDPEAVVITPGVVVALACAVCAYSQPGDPVLIQTPVYYPFFEVIQTNKRQVIENPLVFNGQDYTIDFSDFEAKIKEHNIKLFFFCNPHNPVGRAYTAAEINKLQEICARYNVIVVSDEIHADFIYQQKHYVFAQNYPQTVVCTSPSKTFNLAGLQNSNIIINDPSLRLLFKKQLDAFGYSQGNIMGIIACEAAYTEGAAWLVDLKNYLYDNWQFIDRFLQEQIPNIRLVHPQATYLAWLDCRSLDVDLDDLFLHQARLWLDAGTLFGSNGTGFVRLNFALPRTQLKKALFQLKNACDILCTSR